MAIRIEKPKITDEEVAKYVEYLEAELSLYHADIDILGMYLVLKGKLREVTSAIDSAKVMGQRKMNKKKKKVKEGEEGEEETDHTDEDIFIEKGLNMAEKLADNIDKYKKLLVKEGVDIDKIHKEREAEQGETESYEKMIKRAQRDTEAE